MKRITYHWTYDGERKLGYRVTAAGSDPVGGVDRWLMQDLYDRHRFSWVPVTSLVIYCPEPTP